MTTDPRDLSALRPGDKVAVFAPPPSHAEIDSVQVVARITPGGRIVLDCGRMYRPDGYICGDTGGWGRSRIEPLADKHREQIRRGNIVIKLDQIARGWDRFPTDVLTEIIRLIEENTPAGEKARP